MIKKFTTLASFIFYGILFILAYGAYKSYLLQRENYAANIEMRIGGACGTLIQNDFGAHAARLEMVDKNDSNVGIKKDFTIFNDLLYMKFQGFSKLYFEGYAPQEVTCIADLPYQLNRKINEDTKVEFFFILPLYLPQNYNGYLSSHASFTLTFNQIERFLPLSSLFPLKKPKYRIFNYYESKFDSLFWSN